MSDWYQTHLVIPEESWRDRVGGWLYQLADKIIGEPCHEVVIRDDRGREVCHVVARIPSFNVPPLPYSVWCCEGRIDDGNGHIRGWPFEGAHP